MRIGILGTGVVSQALGGKLAELGHEVVIGTRDVARTMAHREPNQYGMPAFSVWHEQHPQIQVGTFADAARHGDAVINATNGMGSLAALAQAGRQNLAGKILVDIANPLDFSHGMPPTLSVCNTDSLAEQIQAAYPDTRVVKTLNTVTAGLMVNPRQLGGGDHHMFVCGNDAEARAQVGEWLRAWFGWEHVMDLGDITSARAMEMYLPLWLRLFGTVGSPMVNVRVVTS